MAISREKPTLRFFSRAKISFLRKARETVYPALFGIQLFFKKKSVNKGKKMYNF